MDSVEVGGLRIAYERAGTGPPLVLLHGYVGDGPTLWRPQLDTLSDDFTVIAWDAPGAGASSDPPESFGIAGYATPWPASSPSWVWTRLTSPACRSAASSPSPSMAATRRWRAG